ERTDPAVAPSGAAAASQKPTVPVTSCALVTTAAVQSVRKTPTMIRGTFFHSHLVSVSTVMTAWAIRPAPHHVVGSCEPSTASRGPCHQNIETTAQPSQNAMPAMRRVMVRPLPDEGLRVPATSPLVLEGGNHGQFSGVMSKRLRCAGERAEEHTSELQSRFELVCRLL